MWNKARFNESIQNYIQEDIHKSEDFHPLSLVTVIFGASAETNLFDSHPISFPSSSSFRILNFFVQQEKEADCGSGNTSTEWVESSQTVFVPPSRRKKFKFAGSLEIRLSTSISDSRAVPFFCKGSQSVLILVSFAPFSEHPKRALVQRRQSKWTTSTIIFYSHDPLGKIYICLLCVSFFSSFNSSNNIKPKQEPTGKKLGLMASNWNESFVTVTAELNYARASKAALILADNPLPCLHRTIWVCLYVARFCVNLKIWEWRKNFVHHKICKSLSLKQNKSEHHDGNGCWRIKDLIPAS